MCLWCQVNFDSKVDLLQHFVTLHQDMLVPDEGNTGLVVDAATPVSTEKTELDVLSFVSEPGGKNVLDFSSKAKCKLEKNKDGRYTQVVDLSQQEIPEDDNEALDLTKSKSKVEPKDDNSNIVVKAINIPPQDNRPKYSLNSLIEALRNTIEQDKRDGKLEGVSAQEEEGGSQSDVVASSEEEHEGEQSSVKFVDLSSDSESDKKSVDQAGSDTEVQVSVKTFHVDGKTMYRCSKCNKVFSKTCTFARHAMVHAKLYPYQCGLCDTKFRDMRIMLRHLDWHGENVDCPCKKCEKINDEERKRNEAVGTKFRFQCDICLKKFVSDEVCLAHINMHKKKSKLECEICKMEFYCNRKLSRHRKVSHSTQYCPICQETCSDMSSHIQKHPGSVLFRCGLCGDGFNSRPQLHEHLKVHTFLGKASERSESEGKKPQKKAKSTSKSENKNSSSLSTRTVTISSNKIRKGKRKGGSPAASPKKKINVIAKDNIKIETFDRSIPGKIVTKAVILKKDIEVTLPQSKPDSEQDTAQDMTGESNADTTELSAASVIYPDLVEVAKYEEIEEDNVTTPEKLLIKPLVESESPKPDTVNSPTVTGTGISLRRRSSRRCRWHDNDSICERCDVTFIRKIAFERKPKRGRDSPRSSEDNSSIPVLTRDEGIPVNYEDGFSQQDDDDGRMPQLLNMDGEEEVMALESIPAPPVGNIPTFVQEELDADDSTVGDRFTSPSTLQLHISN